MPSPEKTAARILDRTELRPALAIVLGSGFDGLKHLVQAAVRISYRLLAGFTPSTVDGHGGALLVGRLADLPVIVLCGRCHFYEGHSLAQVTFPIRVMAACGVRAVLLTNAAGGINPRFRAGDFMCLADHLNFMGDNPLRGWTDSKQARFLDLSRTYDPGLNELILAAAKRSRVRVHSGVYAAVPGPCYETPAEIRAFASLGADAVGMSTVPEAIVARQCCLRVAAISCITNPAAGISRKPISHAEVLATGERVKNRASALLQEFASLAAASPL
jgi:purine-nucleoside phosphorylase